MFRYFVFTLLLISACGQLKYKNLSYPETQENPDGPPTSNCSVGLTAYQSFVRSIIEDRCSSCHIAGGIAASAFTFSKEQDNINRLILSSLMGGDGELLIRKASGQIPHTGGSVISTDEFALFRSFFAVEKICG